MTSSPTPNFPIRSPHPERLLAGVAMAVLALALGTQAHAHGEAAEALPQEPGVRIGLSAVLANIDADQLLPSNRMAGYLLQGDPGVDRRGTALEHAVVEAGWRLNDTWGSAWALGQHGTDASHVEAAWLQARGTLGQDAWQFTAGRQRPELGPVLTTAGHMDRFAMVPLVKRVAVNDDWIDDGLQLGWRHEGLDVQWSADAGLWTGQVFPGASRNAVVPALHLGAARDDWNVDAFVAHFEPQGRGAVITSGSGAHTHSTPACDAALKQVVCFDGNADLLGASVRWNSHAWPVTALLAGWLRRDSGTLYSANGTARYTGDNQGGWADVIWRFHPQLEVGLRVETLAAEHHLNGSGAALLATEAGFDAYQAASRSALMLGYVPNDRFALRVEAGQEDVAGTQASYVALRLIARLDTVFKQGQ
jgi:hypothetical protein